MPMRIVLILFFVLLAGCGYHLPGTLTSQTGPSDSWVGGDARVLYIQLFNNKTAQPYLENYITNALIAELSRSRLVELTEDPTLADAQLIGAVDDFESSAFAYGTTDRITDYRATMTISAQLIPKDGGEVIWKGNLVRSEDYLAAVNKNLQLEGERLAAHQVSLRLAEALYARLLNSF